MEIYSFNRSKITSVKYIHFRWKQLFTLPILEPFSLVKTVPCFNGPTAPRFLPAWRSHRKLRSRWMVGYHPLCFATESMFVNVCFCPGNLWILPKSRRFWWLWFWEFTLVGGLSIWLVVWNMFFSIYWEESSQLTNIFQRSRPRTFPVSGTVHAELLGARFDGCAWCHGF